MPQQRIYSTYSAADARSVLLVGTDPQYGHGAQISLEIRATHAARRLQATAPAQPVQAARRGNDLRPKPHTTEWLRRIEVGYNESVHGEAQLHRPTTSRENLKSVRGTEALPMNSLCVAGSTCNTSPVLLKGTWTHNQHRTNVHAIPQCRSHSERTAHLSQQPLGRYRLGARDMVWSRVELGMHEGTMFYRKETFR